MFLARYHYENFYLGSVPPRWQLSSELKEKEEDARTRGVRDGEKIEEDYPLIQVRSCRHVHRHIRPFIRERYLTPFMKDGI